MFRRVTVTGVLAWSRSRVLGWVGLVVILLKKTGGTGSSGPLGTRIFLQRTGRSGSTGGSERSCLGSDGATERRMGWTRSLWGLDSRPLVWDRGTWCSKVGHSGAMFHFVCWRSSRVQLQPKRKERAEPDCVRRRWTSATPSCCRRSPRPPTCWPRLMRCRCCGTRGFGAHFAAPPPCGGHQ